MAPIYPRAGNVAVDSASLRPLEVGADDDSLFEDLFVEDSFDSSLLGRWLGVIVDSTADSDAESVDSDVESVDSVDDSESEEDSDDDFPDIKVLANGDGGDETSSASVTASPPAFTTTPKDPGASTREAYKGITPSAGIATSTGGSSGGVRTSLYLVLECLEFRPNVNRTRIESNANGSATTVSPSIVAGVTLVVVSVLVIAGLLLWRRFRRNRGQNCTIVVPFPVEFAHPASPPSVPRSRLSYFSSILPSGGLRFASPPTRFTPAMPIRVTNAPEGPQSAAAFGADCPQPTRLDRGYWFGSGSEWDGTSLVRRSAAAEQPIIFITFNDRTGVLGFIGSAHAPPSALNVGTQDQRDTLRWI
ncbi:hypothetical protein C8J57DRAFT_1233280 [Mycena rebaudengoi]|nr:hypothetical protein C8J57DRAFT_1233280 [Mycena rebaudengoi]